MKKLFTEPSLELDQFVVSDAALFLSGYDLNDPDGLDPVSGAYGGAPAIVV